jgi:flavin reductase (DIM6/NTAB) family NADH-FMN oxidoreductase RutF
VLVDGAAVQFECELERIVDGFGVNSLVIGRIVAAYADPAVLRDADRAAEDVLAATPLLAYVHPGRFAAIAETHSFPFPEDMRK